MFGSCGFIKYNWGILLIAFYNESPLAYCCAYYIKDRKWLTTAKNLLSPFYSSLRVFRKSCIFFDKLYQLILVYVI